MTPVHMETTRNAYLRRHIVEATDEYGNIHELDPWYRPDADIILQYEHIITGQPQSVLGPARWMHERRGNE